MNRIYLLLFFQRTKEGPLTLTVFFVFQFHPENKLNVLISNLLNDFKLYVVPSLGLNVVIST